MKLAFIVQRYGREILGGAETLARQIAERLARRHDIEVLTTTARDYITWRNEYRPGEDKLRGVRINRFAVESERNLDEFNRYSDWIYNNAHSREDELRWLDMQGPVVPELIEYLRREHARYELLVFFTYLYYPTFYGLQVDPERSVLVPTAHDEPPLALEVYREMFQLPSSFIFNTESEELLVLKRFGVYKKMRETIGMGMELLDPPNVTDFKGRHKLPGRYLLYAGRIDEGKGCDELLRFFRFYKEERPGATNLQLILIGQLSMKLPQARDIRYLGFLDEDEKLAAMAAATAVVVPSRLESLSIVVLEAFSVGTPVLVNAGSEVLVEHCRNANAGLFYADYDEFEETLDLVLKDKNLLRGMGRLGQRYIKENFGWEKLLAKYELAFRSSARSPRPTQAKEGKAEAGKRDESDEVPNREEPRSETLAAAEQAGEQEESRSEAASPVAQPVGAVPASEGVEPREKTTTGEDEPSEASGMPPAEHLAPDDASRPAEAEDVKRSEEESAMESPFPTEESLDELRPLSAARDETRLELEVQHEPAESAARSEPEVPGETEEQNESESAPETERASSPVLSDDREEKGVE